MLCGSNFIKNVYYISKLKNFNIGEIEKKAEVSKGYLSRQLKSENPTISLEVAYKISKEINISLDTLVCGDLSQLSSKEQYVYDFIHKLKNLTENEKIEWVQDKIEFKNANDYYVSDNLFSNTYFKSYFVDDYEIKNRTIYFTSMNGSKFDNNNKVIFLNIDGKNNKGEICKMIEVYTYKIYRCEDGYIENVKFDPICNSEYVAIEIKTELELLNKLIFEVRSRIGLNDNSVDVMDYVLNKLDENGNEIKEDVTFDAEEELPFN